MSTKSIAGYLALGAVIGLGTLKLMKMWATKPAFLNTAITWLGF